MNIIKIVFKAANIGCITSDGVVFQAWRQPDQWTSTRIGGVFGTYDAAYDALLSACMELTEGQPFKCAVCGAAVGPNPRLERRLVMGLAVEVLCWVCHRLAASVAKEAGEIALYWKGDDSDAAA